MKIRKKTEFRRNSQKKKCAGKIKPRQKKNPFSLHKVTQKKSGMTEHI